MAFGPIMKLRVKSFDVELAPFNREHVTQFVSGMQKASVIKYLNRYQAQTKESEQEWYDKMLADKKSYLWGIWIVQDNKKLLIGSTSLTNITRNHVQQAISGCAITDTNYWGKGIASSTHKARTWFAFQHLGLTRIKSAVLEGNSASKVALEKSGYTLVYIERNEDFVDGRLRHKYCYECLNPTDGAWKVWWGEDRPTRKAVEARIKSTSAMKWAEKNVELI